MSTESPIKLVDKAVNSDARKPLHFHKIGKAGIIVWSNSLVTGHNLAFSEEEVHRMSRDLDQTQE
ncbi:hypothetical protein ACFL1X_01945 [Candidatus Hydrogenedentota bacterium]